MNYNKLISAIQIRPKFFLRKEDIFELDAFLRGVSYSNFTRGDEHDLYRRFKNDWIPSKFENYTHDWIETISESDDCENPFEYFFVLWKEFQKSI